MPIITTVHNRQNFDRLEERDSVNHQASYHSTISKLTEILISLNLAEARTRGRAGLMMSIQMKFLESLMEHLSQLALKSQTNRQFQ